MSAKTQPKPRGVSLRVYRQEERFLPEFTQTLNAMIDPDGSEVCAGLRGYNRQITESPRVRVL